ncbi:MAG: Kazal domain-containing protein [Nannocystales bacterium]
MRPLRACSPWVLLLALPLSVACSNTANRGGGDAVPSPVQTPEPGPEPGSEPAPDPEPAPEPGSEPSGEGKSCGARAGDTCAADEYCAYEPSGMCGWADATAVCKKRPEMCTQQYDPVCGCDQKEHSNACAAAAAGTGVLKKGDCKDLPGSK